MQRLDAAATLAEAMERRPALRALLEACAPLMELRTSLPGRLAESVKACGFRLPGWDEERAAEGEPLLERVDIAALVQPFREACLAFVPGLSSMHGLSGQLASLEAFFQQDDASLIPAIRAFLSSDAEALASQGAAFELPPAVLAFVLELAFGAVIRAAVLLEYPSASCSQYGPDDVPAPWDARPASWTYGWCPICGGSPSIAYLEEKIFDEKNAFVSGGGGRKHLHCGSCGTEWHFRRGDCPACGREENDALEILREAEGARGERVEWCRYCQGYLPVIDLRERSSRPDMDAQALAMMHLDIVAAEKGLHPLSPAFWNQFMTE